MQTESAHLGAKGTDGRVHVESLLSLELGLDLLALEPRGDRHHVFHPRPLTSRIKSGEEEGRRRPAESRRGGGGDRRGLGGQGEAVVAEEEAGGALPHGGRWRQRERR